LISWNDFKKVDIRVGTVIRVSEFPEARNPSYKLEIDCGLLGIKKSSAQITSLYSKDQLENRQVLAVVNFSPKQIANFISEVLILGVILDNEDVVLIHPDRSVPNGLRIA
jgi:tRNA-binding protein